MLFIICVMKIYFKTRYQVTFYTLFTLYKNIIYCTVDLRTRFVWLRYLIVRFKLIEKCPEVYCVIAVKYSIVFNFEYFIFFNSYMDTDEKQMYGK